MNVRFLPAAGALAGAVLGATVLPAAGGGLQPQGGEIQLTRGVPGDQVNPSIALGAQGGFLVWQDAAIDGQGLGVAALRLGPGGAGVLGTALQVNATAAGDQENPVVTRLSRGRGLVAWQGGNQGFQRIFARVLGTDGKPVGGDIPISSGAGEMQIEPVAVTLADGSVVVAWASLKQDGSYSYDIYARRLDADGALVGEEFRINSTTGMNRRSPALAALPDGGFAAVWIGERQAGARDRLELSGTKVLGVGMPVYEIAVMTARFDAEGNRLGAEQRVSDPAAHAAHPTVAALTDSRVVVAWTRTDPVDASRHYDIGTRVISRGGTPEGGEHLLNVATYGDQYRPRLTSGPHGILGVWTSMGQDGSWEGVFGRWLDADGQPVGDEVPINGQTGGGQILPAVASSPDSDLLVAWSSNLPRTGYELFAQRYAPLLLRVEPSGTGSLRLSWPTVAGGQYQLQSSVTGTDWTNIGSPRSASGAEDAVEQSVMGRVVLYRVLRAR